MESNPTDTPGHDKSDADAEVLCRIAAARRVIDAIAAGDWPSEPAVLREVAELLAAAEEWIGAGDVAA